MKMALRVLLGLVFSGILGGGLPLASQDTYQVAYDAGYLAGQKAGQSDREEARPFDFANKTSFQEASDGFDSSAHDRDVYVVAFRRGFEDGYEVGYGLGQDKKNLTPPEPEPVSRLQRSYPAGGRVLVPVGTLIQVRILETLSTRRNERGDDFRAEVISDVEIGGELIIPEGSRVHGTITHLKQAGRIKGRSEINLLFDEIELWDGTSIPVEATVASIEDRADEKVKDEEGTLQGPGTKGEDAKKVGTATGIGALLGVLTGGGSGAKVGAAVGAVAGLAGVLFTKGQDIVIPSETEFTIKLDRDANVPTGLLRP